jgi:mono/diheme cytochrome c family protein
MRSEGRKSWKSVVVAAIGLWAASPAMATTAAPAGEGARVYEKVCGHCHEAGVGPQIKGRNLPPEYVQRVVRFGNRAMPSFRASEIDDAALLQVARLVGASSVAAAK